MKRSNVPLCCFLSTMLVLAGCGSKADKKERAKDQKLDSWLARTIRDEGIRNAVIAQRTLFPYHFIVESAELNELGKLDLAVLVRHYRDHPGTLNVRRGDAADDLYDSRVKGIRDLLARSGLNTEAIKIADGLAGGEGVQSEHAIRILEREKGGGKTAAPTVGARAKENGVGLRGATAQSSSEANR